MNIDIQLCNSDISRDETFRLNAQRALLLNIMDSFYRVLEEPTQEEEEGEEELPEEVA